MAMITTAQLQVPDASQMTVTMTLSIAEWTAMRDDLQSLLSTSVPLAELTMQLDQIVQKARAQL